eukprot:403335785
MPKTFYVVEKKKNQQNQLMGVAAVSSSNKFHPGSTGSIGKTIESMNSKTKMYQLGQGLGLASDLQNKEEIILTVRNGFKSQDKNHYQNEEVHSKLLPNSHPTNQSHFIDLNSSNALTCFNFQQMAESARHHPPLRQDLTQSKKPLQNSLLNKNSCQNSQSELSIINRTDPQALSNLKNSLVKHIIKAIEVKDNKLTINKHLQDRSPITQAAKNKGLFLLNQ